MTELNVIRSFGTKDSFVKRSTVLSADSERINPEFTRSTVSTSRDAVPEYECDFKD